MMCDSFPIGDSHYRFDQKILQDSRIGVQHPKHSLELATFEAAWSESLLNTTLTTAFTLW